MGKAWSLGLELASGHFNIKYGVPLARMGWAWRSGLPVNSSHYSTPLDLPEKTA